MRQIKILITIVLLSSCSEKMPEAILGEWKISEFTHSEDYFNKDELKELRKRAESTTYKFQEDFTVTVHSGYNELDFEGYWYWDPFREKLVLNEDRFINPNIDTIFISEITSEKMTWTQRFSHGDTSFIHLKKLK